MNKELKKVNIYTDGSALDNGNKKKVSYGGWAYILEYKKVQNGDSGGKINTTNNEMELTAIVKALDRLKYSCEVTIYSDSKYCVDGINKWLAGWVSRGYKKSNKKPIENLELWKRLQKHKEKNIIKAVWVKAHNGHTENEIVDSMALGEAKSLKKKMVA